MGLLSGLNVAALVFGPLWVMYRGFDTKAQYRTFVMTMIVCAIAEALKLALVAALSMVPFASEAVTFLDVLVLNTLLNNPKLKKLAHITASKTKTTTVPLGCASAYAVLHHLLPLYYNASNIAWDFGVLFAALVANVHYLKFFIVCHLLAKGVEKHQLVLVALAASGIAILMGLGGKMI